MERNEHWRQRLLELKSDLELSQAAIAAAMGVPANYVSRLLYPPGKAGRKNLGMDTMRSLRTAYNLSADWFDLPLGSDLPRTRSSKSSPALVVSEPPASSNVVPVTGHSWPFTLVAYRRLLALKDALGPKLAAEAIRDIDEHLNFAVARWEVKVPKQKKSG